MEGRAGGFGRDERGGDGCCGDGGGGEEGVVEGCAEGGYGGGGEGCEGFGVGGGELGVVSVCGSCEVGGVGYFELLDQGWSRSGGPLFNCRLSFIFLLFTPTSLLSPAFILQAHQVHHIPLFINLIDQKVRIPTSISNRPIRPYS